MTLIDHAGNKGKILRGCYNNVGYHIVRLSKDGKSKRFLTHRLVALAFLPPPKDGQTQVDHKDCNPKNNKAENLRWMSGLDNKKAARGVRPGWDFKSEPVTVYDLDGNRHDFDCAYRASLFIGDVDNVVSSALRKGRHFVKGYFVFFTEENLRLPTIDELVKNHMWIEAILRMQIGEEYRIECNHLIATSLKRGLYDSAAHRGLYCKPKYNKEGGYLSATVLNEKPPKKVEVKEKRPVGRPKTGTPYIPLKQMNNTPEQWLAMRKWTLFFNSLPCDGVSREFHVAIVRDLLAIKSMASKLNKDSGYKKFRVKCDFDNSSICATSTFQNK